MNSILSSIAQEVNHPVYSDLISAVKFDFENGAFNIGLSNLKSIRGILLADERVERNLIYALDELIKAIKNKSINNPRTVERIMLSIYPIEYESEDENEEDESDEDVASDEEDESDEENEEVESDASDDNEEMLDLDDVVEKYNELLKNKVLNKYIVAKRYKITDEVKEDEEKREMIQGLYDVVKNVYENFASDKDADKVLLVLEELDDLTDAI